jgi:hypothetical protein
MRWLATARAALVGPLAAAGSSESNQPGSNTRIKRFAFLTAILAFGPATYASTIAYTATDISGNTWQYDYSITNNTLPSNIGEFTTFFTLGQYSNLSVETSPGNWSSIVAQPDPGLPADGFFDAQALNAGLAPGQTQGGFAVRFFWLGQGAPGAQTFNIVDPNTFATLEAGTTTLATPLPASSVLMLSGMVGLALLVRRRREKPAPGGLAAA